MNRIIKKNLHSFLLHLFSEFLVSFPLPSTCIKDRPDNILCICNVKAMIFNPEIAGNHGKTLLSKKFNIYYKQFCVIQEVDNNSLRGYCSICIIIRSVFLLF